jgi:hypothetical protein
MIIVTHAACAVGLVAALLKCKISEVSPAFPTSIYKVAQADSGVWKSAVMSHVSHINIMGEATKPWPTAFGSGEVFIEAGESFEWNQ